MRAPAIQHSFWLLSLLPCCRILVQLQPQGQYTWHQQELKRLGLGISPANPVLHRHVPSVMLMMPKALDAQCHALPVPQGLEHGALEIFDLRRCSDA